MTTTDPQIKTKLTVLLSKTVEEVIPADIYRGHSWTYTHVLSFVYKSQKPRTQPQTPLDDEFNFGINAIAHALCL